MVSYGGSFILAAGQLGEDGRGPRRRPPLQALAPPPLEIQLPAVAALAGIAVLIGGRGFALAAQLFEALADRGEIVGGAAAVHRASPSIGPALPAGFAAFEAEPPPMVKCFASGVAAAGRVRLNGSTREDVTNGYRFFDDRRAEPALPAARIIAG